MSTSRVLPSFDEVSAPTPVRILLRRSLDHRGLMIGGTVFGSIVVLALAAPWLATHDPFHQDLLVRLTPPVWHEPGSWVHPLGTDHLGRDYLARLLYGARISLIIGLTTALVGGLIGTALGVTAGYFGGRVDAAVTFVIITRLALPAMLVALAVMAVIGSSMKTVIIVMGFLLWDRYALVIRAATMQVRSQDYIIAAQAQGCSVLRIVFSEIMPNLMNALIVVATLEMAQAIILEAALSYLGFGVEPPLPSWGLMVADGKDFLLFDPWLITIPGVALFALVLSVNLLGDGLRDVTAPEARN